MPDIARTTLEVLMVDGTVHKVQLRLIDMVAAEREMVRKGITTDHKLYASAMFAHNALRRTVGDMGDFDTFLENVDTVATVEDDEPLDPTRPAVSTDSP